MWTPQSRLWAIPSAAVYPISQTSGASEGDNPPARQDQFIPGGWIPALSSSFGPHLELAEARHKDVLPGFKGAFDNLQQGLYDIDGLLLGIPVFFLNGADDLCFRQGFGHGAPHW